MSESPLSTNQRSTIREKAIADTISLRHTHHKAVKLYTALYMALAAAGAALYGSTALQGTPTTLGKADEGTLSASRAHIYGCRRQVGVAHGDCACAKLDTSKIGRRVGPPALLQCSDLGAQSAAAAGLQDAVKAARH
jgi:hypothetical protein